MNSQSAFYNSVSLYVSIALLGLLFLAFFTYYQKHKKTRELESAIHALADMYSSMTLFDLKEKKVTPLRNSDIDEKVFKGEKEIIYNRERALAAHLATEASREALYQFMRMDQIRERIGDLSHITHEYVDNNGKWNRLHFIVVKRDFDGTIQKLLWAVESIDEDRKRQELFKKLSETDSLTKLLNRTGGETKVSEYLESGKKGLFLMLDADHFKHVNDAYGHDMGDEVIIALANALRETFREVDVIFRLGGDEFVVFAPGVENETTCRTLINRLFENVNKVSFDKISDWKLQISVGAVLCNYKDSFDSLYQIADKAMYQSKEFEGNHVTYSGLLLRSSS